MVRKRRVGTFRSEGRCLMSQEASYSNERYLLHLFACALNSTSPQDIPDDCSWDVLYELATQNGVQGLIWEAAKKLPSIPAELRSTWGLVANSILIRNVQMEVDRSEIVRRLADRGLSYLVLKGAALLPLYPKLDMRTMSDNDVLFGFVEPEPGGGYQVQGSTEEGRADSLNEAGQIVRSIMHDMGYTVSEHGGDVCDIQFSKTPYYRFEMHFALMERHRPYYFYYANPWKRALPVGKSAAGKGREFRFSNEDQYVYMIVHAFKHENMGGEGIRILADIIVSLRAAGEAFNLAYVEDELSRMGIADFERSLRELSLALVEERSLDIHLEEHAMRLVACGHGSIERFVSTKIAEERRAGRPGRFGYLSKLCSPDYYCPGELEFLANNRLLRPFFPIGRLALFLRNALRTPQLQFRKILTFFRGK